MRICSLCHLEQAPDQFTPKGHNRCRTCLRAAVRASYHRRMLNPEFRERERERHRTLDPDRIREGARRRAWKIRGVSTELRDAMFVSQKGLCAICGRAPRGVRILALDHDHSTGAVRALLCNPCNLILGHAGDDPAILQAAIEYLNHHKENPR